MLSRPNPYPAHVCKACGQEILGSEMETPTLHSGVVQCPARGRAGALNIEIRSTESKKPPLRLTGKPWSRLRGYPPFTPEVALMKYLSEKRSQVQLSLREKYLNNSMQLPQSLVTVSSTTGSALRQECKQLLKQVIALIRSETTNVSDEGVTDFLYQALADHYFSLDKAAAMQVFGPMIN